jgi:hypothetical protein
MIEIIGKFLGLNKGKAIFDYFRHLFAYLFPALALVQRTTFARQPANLWKVKQALWQQLIRQTYCDPDFTAVDGFPVVVCKFMRALRGKCFRAEASYGKDHTIKQTFYGFRFHVRICWPVVITRVIIAPAVVNDTCLSNCLRALWATALTTADICGQIGG